jgi:membrane-associated phospholipid phosphatase
MKQITLLYCLLTIAFCYSQSKDYLLLKNIHDQYTPNGGRFMKGVSNAFYPVSIGTPITLFAAGKINKDEHMIFSSYTLTSSLILTGGATTITKWAFNRPRPYLTYPDDITAKVPTGPYSFPSGHTSMAFATATSLSLSYPKWYVVAPSFLYAGASAYSRMYLGVHYPSDVLGGAILGTGAAFICHYGLKMLMKK